MPRLQRKAEAGTTFHVLNRGNGRRTIFSKPADYRAFVEILREGLERYPADLLAYCLMGNHWHLLLRPRTADALSALMRWVTTTHARRVHAHRGRGRAGAETGHVYQGRFKCFPVQSDEHFLTVARYVEGNPLRAKLVDRAEAWPWSSLGAGPAGETGGLTLGDWPVARPRRWAALVNGTWAPEELDAVRTCLDRGRPFGAAAWAAKVADRLDLGASLRPRGRPRKPEASLSKRQLLRRRKADEQAGRRT